MRFGLESTLKWSKAQECLVSTKRYISFKSSFIGKSVLCQYVYFRFIEHFVMFLFKFIK